MIEPESSPDRIIRPKRAATTIMGAIETRAATEIAHHSSPRLEFCPASSTESVCQRDDVSSNAVEVYIHGVRKKLGADLIQTVRGLGYLVPRA